MCRRLGGLTRILEALRRPLRAFRRHEDGVAAIEYVVLAPFYLTMMMGVFELMAISMSLTSMKVGLDDVGRSIRTGQQQCLTDADVRRIVCQSAMISACSDQLEITRGRFSGGNGVSAVEVDSWDELNADDVVLLDANYDWPVTTPLLSPFLGDGSGNFPIRGAVVFKSESFSNASCS